MSDINDDDGRSIDSATSLARLLDRYQSLHADPIVLVFDSSREFLDIDYRNNSKLKVVPAKNADDYIKKYIDKTPARQRRNLRVVTSDNEVFYYAKDSYAAPVKCEEFWGKLNRGRSDV